MKAFAKKAYTRAALTVGVAGDVPAEFAARIRADLAKLPAGPALPAPAGVTGRKPSGIDVDIVKKETRSTAISFGFPIDVTRTHPRLRGALGRALLARRAPLLELAPLPAHPRGARHELRRLRVHRGVPRRHVPDAPRTRASPRRAQIFEIWIRPVVPVNAHMALRVAIHELDKLVNEGISEEDFQTTRDYLMKNVYLLTATQDHALGTPSTRSGTACRTT